MNSEELKKKIHKSGASLVGFADLTSLVPEKLSFLKTGVSIAFQLSNAIIDEIITGPTLTYAHHYRTTNQMLDSIATNASNHIQSMGFQAMPLPASQVVNTNELKGLISHKMVATRAGLGWIGKSALLITPTYGPRVRFSSILTDAPLETSKPISESKCGKCMLCVDVCPAKAIKGQNWALSKKREDLIDVNLCHKTTSQNKETFGEKICGMCISVCPFGSPKMT
ncbi:MAG: epoxyqueuosine reductase [Candidatus Bathyarchaeota archaeon]|nr:MAG: epoxyqueuosine reductase [Candidatus Bathyarchaeota archaeon]